MFCTSILLCPFVISVKAKYQNCLRKGYITCGKYFLLYKNLAFTYIFVVFLLLFAAFPMTLVGVWCAARLLSYQDACLCWYVFLYHLHTSFDASPACSVMQFAGTTPTPGPPPLSDQANKSTSPKYPDVGA